MENTENELQVYLDNLAAAKQQEMGMQAVQNSLAASANSSAPQLAGTYSSSPKAALEEYLAEQSDARKLETVKANRKQTGSKSTGGKSKGKKDSGGKKLTDSAVSKIAEDQVAIEAIDNTEALLKDLDANPLTKKMYNYSMGSWGGVGVPEEYQKAAATMAPYTAQIRNSIFGASLTEGERAAALQLLPDPQDTPEYAKIKLGQLRDFISARREKFINTQKAAGRDVSGVPEIETSFGEPGAEAPKKAEEKGFLDTVKDAVGMGAQPEAATKAQPAPHGEVVKQGGKIYRWNGKEYTEEK